MIHDTKRYVAMIFLSEKFFLSLREVLSWARDPFTGVVVFPSCGVI